MIEVVAATQSKNKLKEILAVSFKYPAVINVLSAIEIKNTEPPVVAETGRTYFDNALLKAQAYSAWSGYAALGDDSGLEVSALENRPGIYSARYAGEGASDRARMEKLLEELRIVERKTGVRDRRARFRCSVVLVTLNGNQFSAESTLEGEILDEPRGTKGFGYDPIVYYPSIGATLAEVDFQHTCEVGFRAAALRALFAQLPS